MSIFRKKDLKDDEKNAIIEYDFINDEVAYLFPTQNFYPTSILFVKPGQEAIFVKEGYAEVFTNGRYELSTNNYPFMKKFLARTYDSRDVYNCYLYFINKEKPIKCYWGTPEPIMIESEKYYGSTFRITGNGEYTLVVENSLKLLSKTVGQLQNYYAEDIDDFIFTEVIQRIVAIIGKAVQKDNILFSQLSSHVFQISSDIKQFLIQDSVFEEYGFKLNTFSVASLKLHDEDYKKVQEMDKTWRENRMKSEMEKRRLVDESYGRAEALRNEGFAEADVLRAKGMAEAEVMHQKGAYYSQERAYDVLQAAASNESAGQVGGTNMMTAGMGLGMGVGLGQGFGQAMGQVASNTFGQGPFAGINNPQQPQNQQPFQNQQPNQAPTTSLICQNCGTQNPSTSKFCNNCGQKLQTQAFCSNCGTQLPLGAKFCGNCGNKCEN